MKWNNKGHEYDGMYKEISEGNRNYYIWGAGTYGIAFYEEFCKEIPILAFIDNNPRKQNTKVCGVDVLSPEDFLKRYTNEIVLVSTGLTRGVYNQLEQYQLKRHEDWYHIDEFSSLYKMYKEDKVYVSDLTVIITQKCSLKCEYCNAFIPKIQKPKDYDINFISEELEYYFRWVDEVNVFGLVGGDAMMHPKFNDILEYIGEKYYPARIKHLEIYSNAVIVPSPKSIELFKKYNVFYRFTDYRGGSGKQNVEEVVNLLNKEGIRYDHVQFDNWYDCGFPQESNGITTEEGLIKFFDACDRKTCHGIFGNKLFFCSMCWSAEQIDYCQVAESDYFDLSQYSAERRKEFLEYYLGFNEKGYFEYCKKCNGGINVNTHKIEVGKQL